MGLPPPYFISQKSGNIVVFPVLSLVATLTDAVSGLKRGLSLAIPKIISVKNARAWVSMDS